MRTRWISAAAVMVAVLSLQSTSRAADPRQSYRVSACSVDQTAVPTDGWTATSTPASASVAFDSCTTRHEFGFEAAPGSGAMGRWTFNAPPGTVIGSMFAFGLVGAGDWSRTLTLTTDRPNEPQSSIWWFTDGQPFPLDPAPLGGSTATEYDLTFSCPALCAGSSTVRVSRVDTYLMDLSPPIVEFDSAERSFRFTDAGGGVDTVDLAVDGLETQVKVGGERCRRPFVYVVPCSLSGKVSLKDVVGSDLGGKSVFATFTDAAGNRTYAGPYALPAAVPQVVATPAPAPIGILILERAGRLRVRYEATKIAGIVRDSEGFLVAGGRVEVAAQVAGDPWTPIAGAQSDSQGRFVVALPKGPSRHVRLTYGGSTATVEVVVAAPIHLSANRKRLNNGQTVRFSGWVPEVGSASTRVTLEARAGGRWIPFRTVQLRNGRFQARYRFSETFASTRYRFRARVSDDPGFVFAAGNSPTVTVLVRPKARS